MDWSLLQAMFKGSFVDLWSPVLLLTLIVVAYVYLRAARAAISPQVTAGQKASFLFGLALYYVGAGSPLDYVGHHYLFSVHMLDQSVLYLIMPLFILHGMPGWMIERPLRALKLERVAKAVLNPLVAIFTFNMLFSFYHVPFIMNAVMENEWLLLVYHTLLLLSAFQMWFPILGNVETWSKSSELKRMAYIFLNGLLLTPACALIIFADKPLYDMYRGVTMPIAGYSVVSDQQLGGTIMKIIQEITYGITLALTFFRWFRTERKKEELSYELQDERLASLDNGLNRA
ncbi:cytochrome c oxidase assembly protein [Gordoniibacillus kamchatkensis]|uniref:cytochrome c oxidase assembly protein n=1 Tax=Gordoniibacillus kamchatkensis TaxID=1590651 RepID=UPI000AC02401|nr:cytochrome c oxidase assembly protein [Paenibacillus sp. VKM B-2647]